MMTLGGILGVPTPTGTSGPAEGVAAGGGASFAGFFDAVVAAASEQGAPGTDTAPAVGPVTEASTTEAGVTPAVILALLGQDVPQTPGVAAPAHRARMFRMDDGLTFDAVVRTPAGTEGDDQAAEIMAPDSIVPALPPDLSLAPPAAVTLDDVRSAGLQMLVETAPGVQGRTPHTGQAVESGLVEPAGEAGEDAAAPSGGVQTPTAPRAVEDPGSAAATERADAPSHGEPSDLAGRAAATAPATRPTAPQVGPAAGSASAVSGADEPSGLPDGDAPRRQDAAVVAGPMPSAAATALRGLSPTANHPSPERTDARTPEASTGGATLDGTVSGPGPTSFDAGSDADGAGTDDARDGTRGESAVTRQMSVGPHAAVPGAPAPAGQPGTAAEPQPVPTRLTPELGGEVTSQIVQSLRTQLRGGIGEAVVRLKPEFLGEVTIVVRLDRGQVDASVKASLPAVREWIEAQEPAVRQSLGEQGLSLTRLRVEPDGERASHDDGRQEQSASQGRNGRPRRERQAEDGFDLLV